MEDKLTDTLGAFFGGKIALYGLGIETEKLIPEILKKFQVVGLLDSYRTEGMLYGLPIISLEAAIEADVELIVVVARPGSCKAIARKIAEVCRENRIALFDIRGNDLCKGKKAVYHFRDIEGVKKDELRQIVAEYDVISVDLFDTLIMRQVLFPTDVFPLVENRLKKSGYSLNKFCARRLECEKRLSRLSAPTLEMIYESMITTYGISDVTASMLAELEWVVDCETILPRNDVCQLVEEAKDLGKEIYIVSDTFYRRKQIEVLLHKCGINGYTEILASCEYGTGKTGKLFEHLKERVSNKTCIHIGDDPTADVECAQKNGIDACQLYSSLELFACSGYLGLWDRMDTFSNRLRIGMFVARLLNSPFQFEANACKISVEKAQDIGYLFFAPIISDFVLWFHEQTKELPNIWFSARDGYLIQKLYDEIQETKRSVYVLTSRTAVIRAGMETKEDIAYVESMKFSGTLQEQLKTRFDIEIRQNTEPALLSDYSEEILARSKIQKRNYKQYLKTLELHEGDIAFFDFVAKGTSQMYLERLVDKHLKGFYFLQLEEEEMRSKGLDITPFYKREELDTSAIFNDYYILETMLTAPAPSVEAFDEEGNPVYSVETRTKKDIECFLQIQCEVYAYFKTYLNLCPKEERIINKEVDEIFLSLIHELAINNEAFMRLMVEDPFFNRMTAVTDLL
ncbi:MAG: HAD hydrolase-like protein [Firmicutes bacterium]|nr:HAD hydrolase-like protein [Bacillota bacterium]